jgi:hypothetical protein
VHLTATTGSFITDPARSARSPNSAKLSVMFWYVTLADREFLANSSVDFRRGPAKVDADFRTRRAHAIQARLEICSSALSLRPAGETESISAICSSGAISVQGIGGTIVHSSIRCQ